jgi:hypothetical protein
MGAPKCRKVGESQYVLIMIDPMISTRTRTSLAAAACSPLEISLGSSAVGQTATNHTFLRIHTEALYFSSASTEALYFSSVRSAQFDHTTHEERPRIVSLPALQVRWMRREGARAKGEAEGTREGSGSSSSGAAQV